ncbi:MAG: neutral/alkaline non-lysosomal ceramidase N-terminal domain-containing protein [Chthoniobacteraceae bacterium]
MKFLSLIIFILLSFTAFAGEFKVGAAQVDITPPDGTPMGGYYKFRAVGGLLDPLYAKTIVVEQDGARAAFVVLDLSGTTRPLVAAARKLIAEQCGLPGDRVMISATHTHTGPQLPRGSLMDDITKVTTPPGPQYVNALPGLIAKSVSDAIAKLAPARASAAVGKAEGISFNRRVIGKDGKCIWQPAKIDPAVERPAGPIDPDLGLLVFDPIAGPAPFAAYVNFAMHPTSVGSGPRVSADYPGVLARLLRERKSADMIAVFANGCCGNINHTDYLSGKPRRNTEQLGAALADVATQSWPNLRAMKTYAPRARSTTLALERRKFSEADIAKAKDIGNRMFTENFGTVPMAEAVCILETIAKQDVPLEVEVQVVAFSDDLAIVSLPGEIFVELGLAIKAASPFKHTFIAELANGSAGYIPNREAYPQGNYEVVSARCEVGSGERLVETALGLLKELARP